MTADSGDLDAIALVSSGCGQKFWHGLGEEALRHSREGGNDEMGLSDQYRERERAALSGWAEHRFGRLPYGRGTD